MKTAHRLASHAKHNPPSFDINMLNYVAPTVPESVSLKTNPNIPALFIANPRKAAWNTRVIVGNQDMPEDHAEHILVKVKAAYELLRTGVGEPRTLTALPMPSMSALSAQRQSTRWQSRPCVPAPMQ